MSNIYTDELIWENDSRTLCRICGTAFSRISNERVKCDCRILEKKEIVEMGTELLVKILWPDLYKQEDKK